MQELPQERLIVGNMAIASAEACFEWTRSYVKDRKVSNVLSCIFVFFSAASVFFVVGCRGVPTSTRLKKA